MFRLRRFVDVIALLTVLAVAGAWWMSRGGPEEPTGLETTRNAVELMHAQVILRSYSDRAVLNDVGLPEVIDPSWFDELPQNATVDSARPWLEIAADTQSGWRHPRQIFVTERTDASFWYNPWLGIVRARVAMQPTDAMTVAQYNRVNGTSLRSSDPKTFGDSASVRLTTVDIAPGD
ncbi:MAG: hypothetical protein AAGF47_10495 [Planctomycetota bacterium]